MVLAAEMICSNQENSFHVRCATHILNLIVQTGLENDLFKKTIEKIRYYCKKIHSSTKLIQFFESQTVSNNEPKLKVVLDVQTRWNSTHEMLQVAIKVKKSITATSIHLENEKDSIFPRIETTDWNYAEKLIDLLEPFRQGKIIDFFKILI